MGRREDALPQPRPGNHLGDLHPPLHRALRVNPSLTLRDRIGVDIGRKLSLEDAVAWAAAHRVRFIDVQLDTGVNALGTIDERRAALRASCERHGIHLGLHTSSAVNVAEY